MVKVSEETIRNILCRESLEADEFVKFQVILRVYSVQFDDLYLLGCINVVQEQLWRESCKI